MEDHILGSIDLPIEIPPKRVNVCGWVLCEDDYANIEEILVKVGDRFHVPQFPLIRLDVAEAFNNPDAAKSGWSIEVDFEPHIGHQIEVRLFVLTRNGKFCPVAHTTTFVDPSHVDADPISVYLKKDQLVEGDIDRIELIPDHHFVRVHGWVVSRGSPVVGILARYGGQWSFTTCDQPRDDVRERYLGQVQPGNNGWCLEATSMWGESSCDEIHFYALLEDTTLHLFAIKPWSQKSDQLVITRIVHEHSKSHLFRLEGWLFSDSDLNSVEVLLENELVGKARINRIDVWQKTESQFSTIRTFSFFEFTYSREVLEKRHVEFSVRARTVSSNLLATYVVAVDNDNNELTTSEEDERALPSEHPREIMRTVRRARPKIRVGVVTHRLDIGGAQLYMRDLLNELRKDPQLEFAIVSEVGGQLEHELRDWGAQVHVIGQFIPTTAEKVDTHVKSVANYFGTFEPDIILANTLHCGYASEIAQNSSCPSILFVHESFNFDHYLVEAYGVSQVSRDAAEVLRGDLRKFDAIVFEAEETLRMLRSDVDENKQHLIRYGIPVSDYPMMTKKYMSPQTTFLSIATFTPRKNQLALVQAFRRVCGRHPNAYLRLIGSGDDPYSKSVTQLVRLFNLSNHVSIERVTPEIYGSLMAADVFVSASDIESMPRSMMEAMLAGCPVLTTRAPGVGELIQDQITGWLVDLRDISELEWGFERVLAEDPLKVRQMGESARNYIQVHHDTREFGENVQTLINDLLRQQDPQ